MADSSAVVPSGSSEPEQSARQNEEASEKSQEVNSSKEVGGSTLEDNNTSNNACAQEKQPSKGKGLSVVFPSDSLVLGYMEPPNPWKNVLFCDTGDLLTSYRTGCDNNNIKPLTKVQQQIHGIENNLTRYEILSLKGEKVDYRHVESLEELFRRVQFKTLDFEASHLDDESSVALFDMIEYYESTCKLNISFNKNIGVRGWQSCARLIKRTPCLIHLDVRNCDLSERVMPIIGRSLKLGAHLTTLHLENTYLSGRVLLILVAALKMNEVLQELFLADNKLMPSDAIQLGNLLKFNHKLYLLDLRNNHLQDVGVGHLSDGLYEQNLGKGLNTLVLWNNQITYQGMPALNRALGSTESLQTLNLGHNNVTNEGIYRLKEGLLKNKSLLRIGLQSTKITCEGAVALAEFIADSRQLLRLDLRENDIKTAGLMALSLALKVNESITKMDVDRDVKKDSGMKDYADQQRRLQMDITNFLSRNKDLVLKREDTERRLMEERAKENTRLKEEREKEAQVSQGSLMGSYLPTCTRIRRPNLLFPVDCPQQTLDSPGLGATFSFEDWPASFPDVSQTPPIGGGNQLMSPPPSELLLSPQYCVRTKAKKLFTVSKVSLVPVSPGQSTCVSSLPSSFPGPSSPMNVLSAMQPEFSQPNSEDQLDGTELAGDNVHTLIHQIVSEAVDMHQKGLDICPGPDALENKIDLAVTELKESLFGIEDIPITSDNGVSHVTCNGFGNEHNSTNKTLAQNVRVNAESLCVNNSGGDDNDVNIKSHQSGKPISDNGTLSTDVTSARNNNKLLSKVDGEISVVNKDPGLHTALTLNGMTRELASVLDTLDSSPQAGINSSIPLDDATTPDEFERELDAMLASVNGGTALTTTGSSS